MAKTAIDIDDDLLARASRVLGTTTKKDTVNAALREVGQRLERLEGLAELRQMGQRGDFDEFVNDERAHWR